MKLSFVIPVYRNEGSLFPTYDKLIELVIQLQFQYEIIFVNDGSDDFSINELISLHKKDNNVKVISFSRFSNPIVWPDSMNSVSLQNTLLTSCSK